MSLVPRKPIFGASDQVRHKPGCTASEDGWRLEISYLGRRGIVLSAQQKQRRRSAYREAYLRPCSRVCKKPALSRRGSYSIGAAGRKVCLRKNTLNSLLYTYFATTTTIINVVIFSYLASHPLQKQAIAYYILLRTVYRLDHLPRNLAYLSFIFAMYFSSSNFFFRIALKPKMLMLS